MTPSMLTAELVHQRRAELLRHAGQARMLRAARAAKPCGGSRLGTLGWLHSRLPGSRVPRVVRPAAAT